MDVVDCQDETFRKFPWTRPKGFELDGSLMIQNNTSSSFFVYTVSMTIHHQVLPVTCLQMYFGIR